MYNRYIPQPDGSYRKNQIYEPRKEPEQRKPVTSPPLPPTETVSPPPSCGACPNRPGKRPPSGFHPRPPLQNTGIISYFRQFLPKDFDAEDLLVILLLLLMAGDCREEQNSALLTLVLYLFL